MLPETLEQSENRQMAEALLETYRMSMHSVIDLGAAMMRWIMASLLAINGGGAVTVLSLPISPATKIGAAGLFVSGILLSLASSYLSVLSHPKITTLIGEAMGYWVSVKIDGERAESMEGHEKTINAKLKETSFWPRMLGYAAVGAFTIGAIVTAIGSLGIT